MNKIKNLIASIFVFCMITITSMPAMASDACKTVSEVAGAIMTARQNGALIAGVLELNKQYDSTGLFDFITYRAYEVPMYASDEFKIKATRQFQNDMFMMCVKASGKDT